ncbi:lipocalin-like domain-containing protein [Winogradskyella sp. A3E31]|uniref:lipocalin-like domain-containing protein n=1 Tax=Winogradskyella sp. A3E31 TaxID=3349637 RepID=UPI00398B3FB7
MKILKTIAVFFLIVLVIGCANQTTISDNNRLTGSWKLYQIQQQDSINGKWEKIGGNLNYTTGYLIYDGQGGMGVHEVLENYENYHFEDTTKVGRYYVEDLKHLASNFTYFGRYRILPNKKLIEHTILAHTNPKLWNTTNQRKYQFKGDTLILFPVEAKYNNVRVVWTKIAEMEN